MTTIQKVTRTQFAELVLKFLEQPASAVEFTCGASNPGGVMYADTPSFRVSYVEDFGWRVLWKGVLQTSQLPTFADCIVELAGYLNTKSSALRLISSIENIQWKQVV